MKLFQMKNIFCRNYTSFHHRLKCYMHLGKVLTPTVSGYQDTGAGSFSFTLMGCCFAASPMLLCHRKQLKPTSELYGWLWCNCVEQCPTWESFLICVLCTYKAKSPLSYQENMYLIFFMYPILLALFMYTCLALALRIHLKGASFVKF